jgi:hypothetical protein
VGLHPQDSQPIEAFVIVLSLFEQGGMDGSFRRLHAALRAFRSRMAMTRFRVFVSHSTWTTARARGD